MTGRRAVLSVRRYDVADGTEFLLLDILSDREGALCVLEDPETGQLITASAAAVRLLPEPPPANSWA
jgi:hypothetical protein